MNLDFHTLTSTRNLPKLDFTEKNGEDPLGIDHFYHYELEMYMQSNLSKVWVIETGRKIIAYFTVSMSAIELQKLDKLNEKVRGTTPKRYPSMLLGRMGVDKKYRGNGIGNSICSFCRGLAIDISEKVACRYLILQTTADKIPFYKKCGFKQSSEKPYKNLYWMYSRII